MSFYGSIIDYSYNVGQAAVLFVMERLPRDLHMALKAGIPWTTRLQIAIDVSKFNFKTNHDFQLNYHLKALFLGYRR